MSLSVQSITINAPLTFGFTGPAGPAGSNFVPDAVGTIAGRDDFDEESAGFSYLANDTTPVPLLYFKDTATSGDWSAGVPFVSGGLANVEDDAAPQLGGNLDVNDHKIVSVSNGDIDIKPNGTGNVILGNFTFDADQSVGAGQDNYVLTYDHATGLISLEASAGGGGATNLSVTSITSTGLTIASSTGTDAIIPAATQTDAGVMTAAQVTRLEEDSMIWRSFGVGDLVSGDLSWDSKAGNMIVPTIAGHSGDVILEASFLGQRIWNASGATITVKDAFDATLTTVPAGAARELRSQSPITFGDPLATGGGSGTVTSVSVTTANGVSGSVANATTTPAITITLGAITPTSINGVVLSGSSTPTLEVTGTASVSGTNTGNQTITLTGDVTGTGTGTFVATIANEAVTFAKMADVSSQILIGRHGGGSGAPQEVSVGNGIEFSGSGIRRAALTGDVTATAGSNTTTIADNAVTNAKLANMATGRVKVRITAGTGDPEDATFAALRTAAGLDLITRADTLSPPNIPQLIEIAGITVPADYADVLVEFIEVDASGNAVWQDATNELQVSVVGSNWEIQTLSDSSYLASKAYNGELSPVGLTGWTLVNGTGSPSAVIADTVVTPAVAGEIVRWGDGPYRYFIANSTTAGDYLELVTTTRTDGKPDIIAPITKDQNFTISEFERDAPILLTKTGTGQVITLPATGISVGWTQTFCRATSQAISFDGGGTLLGSDIASVTENKWFGLVCTATGTYRFI